MIPVHMEPKGLEKDAPALFSKEFDRHISNAIRGSSLLCDAILRAKGLPARAPTRKGITAEKQRYAPELCDRCGTPVKVILGLVSHIQATVSAYYGINVRYMQSAQRGWDIARPRQVAMFLAAELTPKSLPDIGRRFGGRDHTTVMHAIKAVKARILNDPEIALDVEILRGRLAG